MTLADRVAHRFIARATPRLEFYADELGTAIDAIAKLDKYASALGRARDVLRPIAECLRSKPLGKIFVALTGAIDTLPALRHEVEVIVADIQKIDHDLVLEARRHAAIVRAADDDDYEIDTNDIHLPTAAIKALQARIERYHGTVEKTFDVDPSFSVEDIGTAGSTDLKVYEGLIQKLPGWEDLNVAEIGLGGLDDAVASLAFEEAYG